MESATAVQIEHAITGTMIIDATSQIIPGTFSSNRAGCSFSLEVDSFIAAALIGNPHLYKIVLTTNGRSRILRLSMPETNGNTATIQGVDCAEALADTEINIFYDDSTLAGYKPIDDSQIPSARPKMYGISVDETRGFIGLNKGATYNNNTDIGGLAYRVDPLSESGCYGILFEFESNIPSNWRMVIQARQDNFTIISTDATITSNGATIGPIGGSAYGAVAAFFATPCYRPIIAIYNVTGADYTLGAGIESGEVGMKIIRPRLIGPAHTKINTTLSSGLVFAGAVTLTVGSTANMVAGMAIYLDTGNYSQSEKVIITSVLSATQFNATITRTHSAGASVRGVVLNERAIVTDMLSRVRANNSQWITIDTALIIGRTDDIVNKQYYKQPAGAILADLAADSLYDYGVNNAGQLYYFPPGTGARHWSIDIADTARFGRQIQDTYNRTRVEYNDENGVRQVTSYIDQVGSQAQLALIRSHTIQSSVQTATQAAAVRQASVLDTSPRRIQAGMPIDILYDEPGHVYPLDHVRIGDYVAIRNISQLIADDKLLNLRIADIMINYDSGTVEIVPDQPIRRLDRLLARIDNI